MRFAIPPAPDKGKILAFIPKEWPLSLHFAVIVIPFGICIALAATWLGYRTVAPVLRDSLNAVPLLEAKMQADTMENILTQLRRSLFAITEQDEITENSLKKSLGLFFHDNAALVQEIGFRDAQQNGFLLLRDKMNFTRLSAAEASHGLYSPFQQLSTLTLQPGQAALYPPVYFDDPAHISQGQTTRTPVMRMALMLPDQSGTLVLGISLSNLCAKLGLPLRPGSSLHLPTQDGALQMAFFFDIRGWILFETSNTGSRSFLPDLSREGYLGDLGRAGYDAAFRPWAQHEQFWRMVTDVQIGHSGHLDTPADKYDAANVGATGLLNFAPVAFAPHEGASPVVLGGIAFFETSTLPLAAFLRLANYSIGAMVGVILLSVLLGLRINKKLARPLNRMARELKDIADSGELAFINNEPASEEQHAFQSSVNTLIAGAMKSRDQLERLSREMEHARSRQPVDLSLTKEVPLPHGELGMVGSSSLIRELREHVLKVARAGTDVLIWGETGTGKELVATAIHKASARHEGPYVSINCGALDENLLLDVLFGHVKGAFTEAKNDRKGAFIAAQGGTLHLDEIANASLKVQQALLRTLSVRRIRPLGTDEEVPFNTRVVAATNVDLRECVRAGTFREDLYYRLAIISVETPPLRHRKEDIPELAAHCIHEAAAAMGRQVAHLSRGALDLMYAYDWPGNVREFKNCLTRAMAFVEEDLILVQHITLEQDAYRAYAAPSGPRFAALSDQAANAARRSDIATGPSQVAETLFPSPPREKFTPAQREQSQAGAPPVSQNPPEAGTKETPAYCPWPGPDAHASDYPPGSSVFPGDLRREERPHVHPAAEPPHSGTPPASGREAPGSGEGVRRPLHADTPRQLPTNTPGQLRAGASAQPRPAARPSFEGLNERQQRALDFAREKGRISRPQFEEVAGADVSARTLQNDLRELVERGIFRRIGAGPSTYYEPEQA